jgi:hypothetical protein
METQNLKPVLKATIGTQLFDAPGKAALFVCVVFVIWGIVSICQGDVGQGAALIIVPILIYVIVYSYLLFFQKESINKRKAYQEYLIALKSQPK